MTRRARPWRTFEAAAAMTSVARSTGMSADERKACRGVIETAGGLLGTRRRRHGCANDHAQQRGEIRDFWSRGVHPSPDVAITLSRQSVPQCQRVALQVFLGGG